MRRTEAMLVSAQLTRLPPDSSGRSNGSVEVWMRPKKKQTKNIFFSRNLSSSNYLI